mmetsp:Transcript_165/g.617  ORF Transcript_165/g.617 Transcript_165/m.617 type:complete len:241 (+) Transcript_165:81-803(+)
MQRIVPCTDSTARLKGLRVQPNTAEYGRIQPHTAGYSRIRVLSSAGLSTEVIPLSRPDSPTARVKRCVPPKPGIVPSLISGWPNLAVSAARMKSQVIASSQPPPSANPLTAAMIGVLTDDSSSSSPKSRALCMSMYESGCMALMSAPAAKALSPEPVTTMAPISGSASNRFTSCTSSRTSVGDSALSAFGLLRVMSPTGPRRSSRMHVSGEAVLSRRWATRAAGRPSEEAAGRLENMLLF